jgi:predicted Zn-dependent peptidase
MMYSKKRRSKSLRASPSPKSLSFGFTSRRYVLNNGLAVVLCPRPHLSRAYVSLMFGVASRHESKENNGITHVLEHMLFRGTESYKSATALNAAAEAFGGFLEGATYRDHLLFATACHPSAINKAISILGELVQTPRYHAMEVERRILREEILEGLDNQGRSIDIDNISHRMIFGDKGLGLPIEGTLENLEAMTVAQLEKHREQYLVGTNGVISIAGPMDVTRVLSCIDKAFTDLQAGMPPLVPVSIEPSEEPLFNYVRDASSQVELRLSFRAPAAFSASYPSLVMLSRILSDGLSSRMHAELIDKRGLAYSLHAGITLYSDCALFEFDATVAPKRATQMVKAILEFAKSVWHIRLRKDELSRSLRRYNYDMEFMGDSPFELAHWFGHGTLFGIEEHISALPNAIVRVTERDLQNVAQEVFLPRGLVLTAVGELASGQWKEIKDFVKGWK